MASQLGQLQSDVHYCHRCFEWVIGDEWDQHCHSHLSAMTSKRCGTIMFCHTLIRPGYCPFCLGNEALPACERLESWTRDYNLWSHVNEHLKGRKWPCPCPHPLCDLSFEDETKLQFHFMDEHGFGRTRPGHLARLNSQQQYTKPNRKRKFSSGDGHIEWIPSVRLESGECLMPLHPTKRGTTIYPPSLSTFGDEAGDLSLEIDSHETILSPAHVPTGLDLGDGDMACEPDRESHQWASECDTFNTFDTPDGASADLHADNDTLFSQYLRSPSPPSYSSTGLPSEDSGETLVALNANSDGRRIRLRVNPPKPRIVLRFTRPKASIPASKGSK